MRKQLLGLAVALAFVGPVSAQTINNLGAGAAVQATDLFPSYQGSNPAKRVTALQIRTYIESVWGTGVATWTQTPSSANLAAAITDETGSGALVFGTSPTLTTPNLGTPSAATLTNATGLPVATGISGLGSGVATFLATPSSANLAAAVTGETGTGALVFGTSPTISTGLTLGFLTGSSQCLTVDTSGVVSGTGAACGGSGSTGANPTATAGPTAINGSAGTFMRSDAAPAVQTGSSSQKGILQVDGTTIQESSGVISASPRSAVNAQTGTSYTIQNSDQNKLVTFSNASSIAVTLPDPSGGNFFAGWAVSLRNLGAGTVTVTRGTSSTIDGSTSFTLTTGQGLDVYGDGTNYYTVPGAARIAAVSGLGTGVATAAAANLSASGGLTTTIASGTSALGTSAISSGACASVVTTTATGTATTDVILVGFNGDPTGVTGYGASANGMLTIINYPSSNNVNHKVCNNTGSSITPGAITLNWRVLR